MREFLPALDMVIAMLMGKSSTNNYNNPYNPLRYRAEKLRRKILEGKKVARQDFNDIVVDMNRMPAFESVYGIKKDTKFYFRGLK